MEASIPRRHMYSLNPSTNMISPFLGINQIILYPVKTHLSPAQHLLRLLPLLIPIQENSFGMHSLTTSSTCPVDLKAPCSIRCRLHQTTTLLRIVSSTAVNVIEPSPEGANSGQYLKLSARMLANDRKKTPEVPCQNLELPTWVLLQGLSLSERPAPPLGVCPPGRTRTDLLLRLRDVQV